MSDQPGSAAPVRDEPVSEVPQSEESRPELAYANRARSFAPENEWPQSAQSAAMEYEPASAAPMESPMEAPIESEPMAAAPAFPSMARGARRMRIAREMPAGAAPASDSPQPAASEPLESQPAPPSERPLAEELSFAPPSGDASPSPPANRPALDGKPRVVRVFYGTDRKREVASEKIAQRWFNWEPAAIAGAIGLMFAGAAVMSGWRKTSGALAAVSFVAMLGLCYTPIRQWYLAAAVAPGLVTYGNERGELETGVCEVTIPPSHVEGEVESPSILRLEVKADAAKHVILSDLKPLAGDAFYEELREVVAASPRRELLVFIHGYNVTFDNAVRRTAQMGFDLKFQGASVCYSWPSQGGFLEYNVDATNAAWTVPHLKQFLLAIVARTGAEAVNLVAHSMGNRALTSALRDVAFELKERKALFNQVVLAAPDIDAHTFKRDIAPAILPTARQFTLYASSDDQALKASRKMHGYARAGDSGEDLVVVAGIETIDVSGIDTSFLGHSYYASNDAILADLRDVVLGALPAGRRSLLSPAERDGLPYWVLKNAAATARSGMEQVR